MDSIADCWLCLITLQLPSEPVTAKDGKVYERAAIERWLNAHNNSHIIVRVSVCVDGVV